MQQSWKQWEFHFSFAVQWSVSSIFVFGGFLWKGGTGKWVLLASSFSIIFSRSLAVLQAFLSDAASCLWALLRAATPVPCSWTGPGAAGSSAHRALSPGLSAVLCSHWPQEVPAVLQWHWSKSQRSSVLDMNVLRSLKKSLARVWIQNRFNIRRQHNEVHWLGSLKDLQDS